MKLKILKNIFISICIFVTIGIIIGVIYLCVTTQSKMNNLPDIDTSQVHKLAIEVQGQDNFEDFYNWNYTVKKGEAYFRIIKILGISVIIGVVTGAGYSLIRVKKERNNKEDNKEKIEDNENVGV